MNITNIKYFCTTNGDGFRTAVFCSGCRLHCRGCFNKAAWDFKAGKPLSLPMLNDILNSLEPDYIEGLSILGGEPMDPNNQQDVSQLIQSVRSRYGNTKTIWVWTGYTKDNIPETPYKEDILNNIDTLVDGPYIDELSDIKLQYRGSSNQNIIKLK